MANNIQCYWSLTTEHWRYGLVDPQCDLSVQCSCTIQYLKKVICPTYDYIALTRKIQSVHKTFLIFNFITVIYFLSVKHDSSRQCRILCNLRLFKLSKSAILIFLVIASFLKKVVCTRYDYILHWKGKAQFRQKMAYCTDVHGELFHSIRKDRWFSFLCKII